MDAAPWVSGGALGVALVGTRMACKTAHNADTSYEGAAAQVAARALTVQVTQKSALEDSVAAHVTRRATKATRRGTCCSW